MRYALISDVHANLPALDAVLDDIERRGREKEIAATYHLGDLVGYAPWPNEVVERIATRGIPGVAGNYDSTVASGYKHCGCRYEDPQQEALSHVSYQWTLHHVDDLSIRRLGALPFRIDIRPLGGHIGGPTVTLVHGNETLNTVYVTQDRSDDFLTKMRERIGAKPSDVIVFGHTHIAWHRIVGGVHFINTGSVGRPKDGDWRAGYVMLDVADGAVTSEIVRVDYDLAVAMETIQRSDLPDEFAEYLRTGGRP